MAVSCMTLSALLSRAVSWLGRLGRNAGPVLLLTALGMSCLWLHHEVEQARERAVLWEQSARASQAALAEALNDRRDVENALRERRQAARELAQEQTALRARLEEVQRHDQTVRRWRDEPLPDAVRGVLAKP